MKAAQIRKGEANMSGLSVPAAVVEPLAIVSVPSAPVWTTAYCWSPGPMA
jgi:hypothetical protein